MARRRAARHAREADPKINWWRFGLTLLAVYAAFFFISSFFDSAPVETVSYTQFTQQVDAKNVKEIYATGLSVEGKLKVAATDPASDNESYTEFRTEIPTFANTDQLSQKLQSARWRSGPSRSAPAAASSSTCCCPCCPCCCWPGCGSGSCAVARA